MKVGRRCRPLVRNGEYKRTAGNESSYTELLSPQLCVKAPGPLYCMHVDVTSSAASFCRRATFRRSGVGGEPAGADNRSNFIMREVPTHRQHTAMS